MNSYSLVWAYVESWGLEQSNVFLAGVSQFFPRLLTCDLSVEDLHDQFGSEAKPSTLQPGTTRNRSRAVDFPECFFCSQKGPEAARALAGALGRLTQLRELYVDLENNDLGPGALGECSLKLLEGRFQGFGAKV